MYLLTYLLIYSLVHVEYTLTCTHMHIHALILTCILTLHTHTLTCTLQYRFSNESLYHAYNLTLETKEKPLSVMIDGNAEEVVDNVIK